MKTDNVIKREIVNKTALIKAHIKLLNSQISYLNSHVKYVNEWETGEKRANEYKKTLEILTKTDPIIKEIDFFTKNTKISL